MGVGTASGYGVQGKSLLPRLAELPEFGGRDNIAMFAWFGLQGGKHEVHGFQVYPAGADAYGNDIVRAHTQDFAANLVVSLIDVWVLVDHAQKVAPALWCPYMPIDHDPVPPRVLECLQGAHLPITYAKWGHDKLKAAGVDNVYVPHGIEESVYKVLPRQQALDFKHQLCGTGKSHLTVIVAANKGYPDRKAFQVQLRAWADFAKDKPHAKLYMHTEPTPMWGGLDLPHLTRHLGIAEKVIFPDRYHYFLGLPPEYLALIYNSADVLLSGSMSEGFGIPIIEAQACGAPVVVTDFSAMPELVRWGYAVPPADMFWTPMNSFQAWPSASGMRYRLEELHAEWERHGCDWPIKLREECSAKIHHEFGYDAIVRDQWAPLMARLAQEAPPLPERYLTPVAERKTPKPYDLRGKVGVTTVEGRNL